MFLEGIVTKIVLDRRREAIALVLHRVFREDEGFLLQTEVHGIFNKNYLMESRASLREKQYGSEIP